MKIDKNTNLRFAKEPKETGLYAVGHPNSTTNIKINGKIAGSIVPPSWNSKHTNWVIRIAIEEDGTWRWVQFKQQFETEPEGRKFVIDNISGILKKYKLHLFEY